MFIIDNNQKKLQGLKFIDLFSGIGGFHLALSSYGGECVFASEKNETASDIYYSNFKLKPHGDVRKIKSKDIPKHDIICAGFPCQPFSISGNRNGFNDDNGKLFFEIIRIARHHMPRMIILENVKNLLTHDNGKSIELIEKSLARIGYTTYKKVLCASDFSVPQARKRIYILAFRNDLEIADFDFPVAKGDLMTVKDILEPNVDPKYTITASYDILNNNSLTSQRSNQIVRIGSIAQGRQGERIYSLNGQGITLSSQGGGLGGKTGMYYFDNHVRKLTPRECARMMGFPENFIIAQSDYECYKQFGNSVVINVIQEIIREALKYIV